MGAPRPPMDYLAKCSQMSLESMELARLNQSANLRKEFLQVLHELIESEVDARLARAMLEWRRSQGACEGQSSLLSPPEASIEASPLAEMPGLGCCEQLAMAFQADPTAARDGDSRHEQFEMQPYEPTQCASSRANVGASEKSVICASRSIGRRAASARSSRVLRSPNTQDLRYLRAQRLADSGETAATTSPLSIRLSLKHFGSRRVCGNLLPRQNFANAAPAFAAYAGALRDAS